MRNPLAHLAITAVLLMQGASVMAEQTGHVTGIGGVFVKSKDPKALAQLPCSGHCNRDPRGRQPRSLTRQRLIFADMPLDWRQQRILLGFSEQPTLQSNEERY